MSKKKRVIIISVTILLMVLGFVCITIAANTPATFNKQYSNVIGLSSFVFWGLALIMLIKNYSKMVSSEMFEAAEKMKTESDFYSLFYTNANPHELEERFANAGFKKYQNFLRKRQFSFIKDYINYYVAIAEVEDIQDYFNNLVEGIEEMLQNQAHLHRNNIVYVFVFTSNLEQEKLDYLQEIIINQETIQGIPGSFDTVLPVVYDKVKQRFIIRTIRRRYSIALLDIALRKLYKMMGFKI